MIIAKNVFREDLKFIVIKEFIITEFDQIFKTISSCRCNNINNGPY